MNYLRLKARLLVSNKQEVISILLKTAAYMLLFIFMGDVVNAQTEIQSTITTFFNDVIIPVGGVLVTIATFGGLVYSAMLFSQGSPKAKGVLVGVIVAAIVFYGGGLLLSNLFANFGSTYTISFLEPVLNVLPALV